MRIAGVSGRVNMIIMLCFKISGLSRRVIVLHVCHDACNLLISSCRAHIIRSCSTRLPWICSRTPAQTYAMCYTRAKIVSSKNQTHEPPCFVTPKWRLDAHGSGLIRGTEQRIHDVVHCVFLRAHWNLFVTPLLLQPLDLISKTNTTYVKKFGRNRMRKTPLSIPHSLHLLCTSPRNVLPRTFRTKRILNRGARIVLCGEYMGGD